MASPRGVGIAGEDRVAKGEAGEAASGTRASPVDSERFMLDRAVRLDERRMLNISCFDSPGGSRPHSYRSRSGQMYRGRGTYTKGESRSSCKLCDRPP